MDDFVASKLRGSFEILRGMNLPPLSREKKGAIIGAMNEVFGGDEFRRIVATYLFFPESTEPLSSNNLTDAHWHTLSNWIDFYKDYSEGWLVSAKFKEESLVILNNALAWLRGKGKSRKNFTDSIIPDAGYLGGVVTNVATGNEAKFVHKENAQPTPQQAPQSSTPMLDRLLRREKKGD